MSCEAANQILKIKRHDTLPYAKGQVVEPNADTPNQYDPVDITGATIKFNMVTDDDTRTVKVSSACVITDEANGEFQYEWAAIDTNTAGNYLGEFEITFASGKKISLPNGDTFKIKIFEDYDNA